MPNFNIDYNIRIERAINSTKELLSGYFEKTCRQRIPELGCGSVFKNLHSIQEIENAIRFAHWELYLHRNIAEGCTAFVTSDIKGYLGIVDLDILPKEKIVVLDDRKNTGNVSATVSGERGDFVDFTVIILGEEQWKEVVYTFHPGEPVQPSKVKCKPGMHGKEVTVAEALEMGLKTAKIVQ